MGWHIVQLSALDTPLVDVDVALHHDALIAIKEILDTNSSVLLSRLLESPFAEGVWLQGRHCLHRCASMLTGSTMHYPCRGSRLQLLATLPARHAHDQRHAHDHSQVASPLPPFTPLERLLHGLCTCCP